MRGAYCTALFCMFPSFFVYPIDKVQKRAILRMKVKDSQYSLTFKNPILIPLKEGGLCYDQSTVY